MGPLPRPTVLPKWAMEDQIDPISLQENVVEPPPERKLSGWTFQEKPNRQYWNWFQRQTSLWIEYFAENLDFDSDFFVPTISGINPDPSVLILNSAYYSKEGDRVYLSVNLIWNGNAVTGPMVISNLPYTAKNAPGPFNQSMHITRGGGPTFPVQPGVFDNPGEISALISANTTNLTIWNVDFTTGVGAPVPNAGNSGQLIINGFYFIEE